MANKADDEKRQQEEIEEQLEDERLQLSYLN